MLPAVTITPAAARFIQRVVRFSGLGPQAGLRLAVSPGGCSGYNSEFSPETAPAADEQMLEADGVRLFLGAESRLLLNGIVIDFVETATQTGLTFTDPHKAACACSTADAAKPPGVATVSVGSITRGRPPVPAPGT